MSNLVLNIYNPYSAKHEHRAQKEYLTIARRRARVHKQTKGACGIQKINYVGGRGSGKTTIGIVDMVNVAMENPNFRTFWSEETHSDIDRILISELNQIVPQELFKIVTKQGGYRYIQWVNGHKTDLLSRYSGNSKKRAGLGGNMMGGWFDELATGFDKNKIDDIANSIRAPFAPYYFIAGLSTPLPNGFEAWCNTDSTQNVFASSWDNPHLNKAVLDSRAKDMSPEQVQRELYGKFVAVGGRIWKYYKEEFYPKGNLFLNRGFRKDEPWALSVDLGSGQSAFGIWQWEDSGNVMVLVEQWCPNGKGFEEVLEEIVREYCDGSYVQNKPQMVWIGHDVNTKNSITTTSGAQILSKIGWNWTYPAGHLSSKEIQRYHLSNLLYQKKICFSVIQKNNSYVLNKSHYLEGKNRGALNVMRNDTYPTDGNVFNKDKGRDGIHALEDDRDQLLYASILWKHPDTIINDRFYQ